MFKIYKIIDNTNGHVYIGKTKQKYLCDRMSNHVFDYKRDYCCSSKEIIKNGDYRVDVIEETDDKTRERYWIENTECVNKLIPGRTNKEWKKENKVKHAESNLKYYIQRRDWQRSMGGCPKNYHNNSLLKIDINLFTS